MPVTSSIKDFKNGYSTTRILKCVSRLCNNLNGNILGNRLSAIKKFKNIG